ncbi:CDP-diacylglycerol--glycerol-3-phosphate 3-phosphatidyltransferase [Dissulfurirhabdus thermomarina]|uniref:CDP-diacylglycerol--glycerol-3-phosphate 3-phosphatidyltransferase n=1 Tax=Dissulfurirhabdus thermomarina TaxID=1765737 RepID=A0A6N9TM43_DISTH|nr:CDP-alcohol phosphatidyltransferase family protein [Dissulfurirhabdus thermomarina]NDY42351.1 CDP-diacylglycerol--glycerol-3-phosphate 3-phosphatidyltransferase [Dissulfurirhabdus thermomarina]NMX24213.1 CDP-diacylglycerol--glycerol-3-phosphate 3-phosphatidyltransferase [Dissulfurirhabdus thermomarina]
MNLPNLLTLLRILLVPLLVICLIERRMAEALAIFAAAGFTDALDGFLARWLRQKTRLGAVLDPIADKLLLMSACVTLAVIGRLPGWLAVIVISRDVIILLGVGVLFLILGGVEIRPSFLGKVTTFCQLFTVFLVLAGAWLAGAERWLPAVFWATAAVTVASGLHYMARGLSLVGAGNGGRPEA